jgi:hypothetical protein
MLAIPAHHAHGGIGPTAGLDVLSYCSAHLRHFKRLLTLRARERLHAGRVFSISSGSAHSIYADVTLACNVSLTTSITCPIGTTPLLSERDPHSDRDATSDLTWRNLRRTGGCPAARSRNEHRWSYAISGAATDYAPRSSRRRRGHGRPEGSIATLLVQTSHSPENKATICTASNRTDRGSIRTPWRDRASRGGQSRIGTSSCMDRNSLVGESRPTFVVDHPAFGKVTFTFRTQDASRGFAATNGFVFFGIAYPEFDFGFQRQGSAYVPCKLNDLNTQLVDGKWRTTSDIAPPSFRSFALAKAKELADGLKRHS